MIHPSVRACSVRLRLRREPQRHRLLQEARRLVEREAQVVDGDLGELAARAQPRQRQVGLAAGAEHEVEVGRLVVENEGDRIEHLLRLHDLEVVEHEGERRALRRQVVEQRAEDGRPA